jgi:hypothetical protein
MIAAGLKVTLQTFQGKCHIFFCIPELKIVPHRLRRLPYFHVMSDVLEK